MTPEQRLEKLEKQTLQLQTRLYALSAETLTLQAMLRPKDSAASAEWDAEFLAGRNERLQTLLLLLEHTDPELAAELSRRLDQPGMNFPVKFD